MQGITLLVLSKQLTEKSIYLDELNYKITNDVNQALNSIMVSDKNSIDYLMLVYTIVIRTLTSYTMIDEINVLNENINKEDLIQTIDKLITDGLKNIHSYLTPNNFNKNIWNNLTEVEKFYFKCLEFEKNSQNKLFDFQKIAKIFHISDYKFFLEITKDYTKVKSLHETIKITHNEEFNKSLLKDILIALHKTIENDDTITGSEYLKDKLNESFWTKKSIIITILDYIGNLNNQLLMPNWSKEAHYAMLLSEYIKNVEI